MFIAAFKLIKSNLRVIYYQGRISLYATSNRLLIPARTVCMEIPTARTEHAGLSQLQIVFLSNNIPFGIAGLLPALICSFTSQTQPWVPLWTCWLSLPAPATFLACSSFADVKHSCDGAPEVLFSRSQGESWWQDRWGSPSQRRGALWRAASGLLGPHSGKYKL